MAAVLRARLRVGAPGPLLARLPPARLPSGWRCCAAPSSTSAAAAAHPLAGKPGRGAHPPDARRQWRPHDVVRLDAVRRPWSEKARSRAHVRALRRDGMVPATIASAGPSRDLPVAVSERALVDELERGAFFNRPFELEVDDSGSGGEAPPTTYRVVPTQINFHPVKNTPMSVVFYHYTPCDNRTHLDDSHSTWPAVCPLAEAWAPSLPGCARVCPTDRNVPRKFDVPLEVLNRVRYPRPPAAGPWLNAASPPLHHLRCAEAVPSQRRASSSPTPDPQAFIRPVSCLVLRACMTLTRCSTRVCMCVWWASAPRTAQERAPGLRGGGHVRLALETVPVQALCDQVPRSLPVDIGSLEMGGAIQICELEWPNTINLLLAGRPQQTLVKIIDRIR